MGRVRRRTSAKAGDVRDAQAVLQVPGQNEEAEQLRPILEDSWQEYASESDSRQGHALYGLLTPGSSALWKQEISGDRRGNYMLYFGKVILKVTGV